MINFNRIDSNIFIGSAPQTSQDVARLSQLLVTAVLSLQSDEDFRTHRIDWKNIQSAYQQLDITLQRFQINDFDETDMANKLVSPVVTLNDLLNQGHRVYVHCNAGVCRAPGTVLGYLCSYKDMTIEQGLDYIRRARPQANPYVAAVKKAINQLAAQGKT
ncbi:MAG: protein-tyrosine phosphatase [Arenicella sp.]|jgi:protein-tyrosine phosphatase